MRRWTVHVVIPMSVEAENRSDAIEAAHVDLIRSGVPSSILINAVTDKDNVYKDEIYSEEG